MRIALFGSYGQGNIGDEAIADGLAKIFKAALPEVDLILFSHLSPVLADTHPQFSTVLPMIATGIRSLWQQLKDGNLKRGVQVLKDCNWIAIGGGGIFHDQEVSQKGFSPLFIWWLRSVLFKLLGRKVAIAAVGIGPLNKRLSQFWLRGILKRADIITVRDQASQKLASACTSKKVTVVPDPVWGLFTKSSNKNTDQILGINIRENHRLNKTAILEQLIKNIKALKKITTFKEIQLIPFALANPDDREIMKLIANNLRQTTQLPINIVAPKNTREAFDLVSNCNYFLAMRFHSYIFAESAQVPSQLISYSSKTDEITKYPLSQYLEDQTETIIFWRHHLATKS